MPAGLGDVTPVDDVIACGVVSALSATTVPERSHASVHLVYRNRYRKYLQELQYQMVFLVGTLSIDPSMVTDDTENGGCTWAS